MKYKLKDIALFIDGDISGDPNLEITGVSEIQNGKSGTITFLGNQAYKKHMDNTKASAVIVSNENHLSGKDGIIVKNPQFAIAKVLSKFFPNKFILFNIPVGTVIISQFSFFASTKLYSSLVLAQRI